MTAQKRRKEESNANAKRVKNNNFTKQELKKNTANEVNEKVNISDIEGKINNKSIKNRSKHTNKSISFNSSGDAATEIINQPIEHTYMNNDAEVKSSLENDLGITDINVNFEDIEGQYNSSNELKNNDEKIIDNNETTIKQNDNSLYLCSDDNSIIESESDFPSNIEYHSSFNADDTEYDPNIDTNNEMFIEVEDQFNQEEYNIINTVVDDEEDIINSLPHDRKALLELINKILALTQKNVKIEERQNIPRNVLIKQLYGICSKYYEYNLDLAKYIIDFFGPKTAIEFFNANEHDPPFTIRTNTIKTRRKDLAQRLIARGCNVDVIGDWNSHGLIVNSSTIAVGATPEYLAGHYMLQSASSFLPVMALSAIPNETCLDMAAAPGGKTTYIAQYMKNTGILVANDLKKDRLAALAANIHRLGVINTIITNLDGRNLLKYFKNAFDRVLIDAPCTGLGVISKNSEVKTKRKPADFIKSSNLQRELLLQAIDLVNAKSKTGGIIVYSTCSISFEENEAVVNFALSKRNVKLVDTGIKFGVAGLSNYKLQKLDPSLVLTRRFYPHTNNMDGFFVAKFKKLSNTN